MIILEKKISFFERYNHILENILHPEVIYIDEELIWKRFRKEFVINHLKLRKIKYKIPEILENLSNNDIYHALVKSCGTIIKEIM